MGRLTGKVALITGAGHGMGRAAAALFAQEEAKVAALDIDGAQAEETVRRIRTSGGTAYALAADVSKSAEVRQAVRATVKELGALHILYNNAAIWSAEDGPAADVDERIWAHMLDVNLTGVYLGCRYGIPEMLRAGGGSIINTASPSAIRSIMVAAAYAASKGGVLALTRSIAQYYGQHGIRANALMPSGIETRMSEDAFGDDEGDQFRDYCLRSTPLGRLGAPVDVAQAALYLASDESAYVTGTVHYVDGGWMIGPRSYSRKDSLARDEKDRNSVRTSRIVRARS
jgi:NAD(P)-dependent dehydrogenase (short-subunit alcohol dehydrogenase family)